MPVKQAALRRADPKLSDRVGSRLATPAKLKEAVGIYFIKAASPAHLRWLKVFEPVMMITGIEQPLATIPSISKCISRVANTLPANH